MPFALTYEQRIRTVHARAYGTGRREEGLDLIAGAFDLARQRDARALIIDILDLEFVPSNADASVFSGRLAEIGRLGVRVAIVAPAGAPFGVARMVGILAELTGASVTVCTSLEEAFQWARFLSGAGAREET